MRTSAALVLLLLVAAPAGADDSDIVLGRKLATLASDLYQHEKEISRTIATNGQSPVPAVESTLFEDVLTILDAALNADPDNVHAHAISADVLVTKALQEDGTFDICTLLDAGDAADFVLKHRPTASTEDATMARSARSRIAAIPRNLIPDDPSVCADDSDQPSTVQSVRLRTR